MEIKYGALLGDYLTFLYKIPRIQSLTQSETFEPNFCEVDGFRVRFDENKHLFHVLYPCGCAVTIDAMFYVEECDRKPPLIPGREGLHCPTCDKPLYWHNSSKRICKE